MDPVKFLESGNNFLESGKTGLRPDSFRDRIFFKIPFFSSYYKREQYFPFVSS